MCLGPGGAYYKEKGLATKKVCLKKVQNTNSMNLSKNTGTVKQKVTCKSRAFDFYPTACDKSTERYKHDCFSCFMLHIKYMWAKHFV